MASGPRMDVEKMEARQSYRNIWHTDLMRSPLSDPLFCCFALWCGPCASYMMRRRALYNDMSRYTCCGGYMPCSGKCGENKCPAFCLCTEVFLCFGNSVSSTRFMLQDEFNIQTTKCDNCIIGFMLCISQLACIFSLIALIVGIDEIQEAAQLLNCLVDLVYCSVCPCMQTQHKVELDKRDGKFEPPQAMAAPPVQQMSRANQPLPPPIGYPPPSYGQPLGVYFPPQPQTHGQPPPLAYPPPPQPPAHPPAAHSPQPQDQSQPQSPAEGHPPTASPPQGHPPAAYPPPSQDQSYPPPAAYPPQPQWWATYPPQPQAQGHRPPAAPPQSNQYPSTYYPPAGGGYPPQSY